MHCLEKENKERKRADLCGTLKAGGIVQVCKTGSPDDAVLQPAGDDVDGHALRLVGEGHRADDLSAVDVTDQVAVHRPQAQVAASAHCMHRITRQPRVALRTQHDRLKETERSSPESQTVAMSPVVSLADTAVTGLLWPVRLWT